MAVILRSLLPAVEQLVEDEELEFHEDVIAMRRGDVLFPTERGVSDRALVVSRFVSSVIRPHGQRDDPRLIGGKRKNRRFFHGRSARANPAVGHQSLCRNRITPRR